MKKILSFMFILTIAVALSSMTYAANLVINGGFEIPEVVSPSGWDTFLGTEPGIGWDVYYMDSSWGDGRLEIQRRVAGEPNDGYQHAELDSYHSTRISQEIPTRVGYKYEITYYWSPRPNIANNHMEVYWGADRIGDHSASGGSSTNWNRETFTLLPEEDSSTKLEFMEVGVDDSYGMYLDGVSVMEIPIDDDDDGVIDIEDRCKNTNSDSPDDKLGVNRHVWYEGNNFTTLVPARKGTFISSDSEFSLADTYGCSCEQILGYLEEEFGWQMEGHHKFGCSKSVIQNWILDWMDGVLDGRRYIDTVSVPSDETVVATSESIKTSHTYLLEASGTYAYATWAGNPVADAKCSYRGTADPLGYSGQWISGDLLPIPYTNYLEVKVNGGVVDWGVPSGDCSPDNTYSMEISGVDHFDFNIYDGGSTGDNSGSIQVDIYQKLW